MQGRQVPDVADSVPGEPGGTDPDAAPAAERWSPSGPTPTGLGSWPGTDPLQACREIFTELGGTGLPHPGE